MGLTCKAYNQVLRKKYERVRMLSFLGKYIGKHGSHALLDLFTSNNFRFFSDEVIYKALKNAQLEFLSRFRDHEYTRLTVVYQRHNFFFEMDWLDFSSLVGKAGNPAVVNHFAQLPASLDMHAVGIGYVRGGHLELVKPFVTLKNLDRVLYVACSNARLNILVWLYSHPTFGVKLPQLSSPRGSVALCDQYMERVDHFLDLIKFVEAGNGRVDQLAIVRRCLFRGDLQALLYLEQRYGCVSSRQVCPQSFVSIIESLIHYQLRDAKDVDFFVGVFTQIPRFAQDCSRDRVFRALKVREEKKFFNTRANQMALQRAIDFFTKFYHELEGNAGQ